MPSVTATERILERRRLTLSKMFLPLVPSKHVQIFFRYFGRQVAIGLGPDTFGTNLRQARHRTRRPDIFLNYFESWSVGRDADQYLLNKAYMHLDEPLMNGDDKEVLALHCDPDIAVAEVAYTYKRGPHFHISSDRPNFSKAHIATCVTNLEHTCSSLESLSEAFAAMVLMVSDEFLERL
jgi:hypothetical protein